jgi:predicted transcriptional regulator
MPLSVRLDDELERLVEETARALKRTRSEVVKLSLRDYCQRTLRARETNPYVLAADLLGRAGSGRGDLSVRGHDVLKAYFNARRSRRSR